MQAPSQAVTSLWTREASGPRPLVSICIPSFNHSEYVEASVRSALEQTYEPLEVIVSDDRSEDDSYERLQAIVDSRLHLEQNQRRLGHAGNRNRVLSRASGELVKFLDDDDLLEPTCLADMVLVFAGDPRVGLVFGRRRIAIEGMMDDERADWLTSYGDLQRPLCGLQPLNDGRWLFEQLLARDFHVNLIGEPSAVMVSRTHLRLAGSFSSHVHQLMDLDLWCRILPHGMVGFVGEEVAVYRIGHRNASRLNNRMRRAWLDRLWILENLMGDPEVAAGYPRIRELLRVERRQAWRAFVQFGKADGQARVPARLYVPYARYRLSPRIGQRSRAVH